jgi:hypothetical protein
MSHFIVNLILPQNELTIEKIEELLGPYDESKELEPYIYYYKRDAKKLYQEELSRLKGILDRKDKDYKLDVCQKQYDKLKLMTADQYYDFHFEGKQRDKAGNILSTYNPDSKWDWWEIGGRFAGWLLNLAAEKANNNIKNNSCPTEKALKEKKIPFALILPDGKWVERGSMGWWAVVMDEMPEREWDEKVMGYYKKYPRHAVVQLDCHI